MTKIVKNLRIVDQSENVQSDWEPYFKEENLKAIQKIGVISNNSGKLEIVNKNLFYNKTEDKVYIFKKNSFKPHKEDQTLEISTAVNEFVWTTYINKLISIDEDKYSNLKEYVPTELALVLTDTKKGNEKRKNVCSITSVQEGFYNRDMLESNEPDAYEELKEQGQLSKIPNMIRIFSTLIGKHLKMNDILFNVNGERKVIDTGDASPILVEYELTTKQFFEYITNKLSVEEGINVLEDAIILAKQLIALTPEVIKDVYAIYNKIDLEKNPGQKNRVAALKLYEKVWDRVIEICQDKIKLLNNEVEEIDTTINLIEMMQRPIEDVKIQKTKPKAESQIQLKGSKIFKEEKLDSDLTNLIKKEESKLLDNQEDEVDEAYNPRKGTFNFYADESDEASELSEAN